jgi:hypothetical protein
MCYLKLPSGVCGVCDVCGVCGVCGVCVCACVCMYECVVCVLEGSVMNCCFNWCRDTPHQELFLEK